MGTVAKTIIIMAANSYIAASVTIIFSMMLFAVLCFVLYATLHQTTCSPPLPYLHTAEDVQAVLPK